MLGYVVSYLYYEYKLWVLTVIPYICNAPNVLNCCNKHTIKTALTFAVLYFMYFVLSNIQHVSGFWGLRSQSQTPPELYPWTPLWDFRPQALFCPLPLSKFLATPLAILITD